MNSHDPQKLIGISEISDKFDVYFIDLWGVIHNGVQCYPEALKVLEKLKEQMEAEIPLILKNEMVIQFHEERLIDLEERKNGNH